MVRSGYGSGLAIRVTKVVLNESAGEGGVVLVLVFRQLRSELPEYAYVMEQSSENEALFLGHVIFAIGPEVRSRDYQVSSGRGRMSICPTGALPWLARCGLSFTGFACDDIIRRILPQSQVTGFSLHLMRLMAGVTHSVASGRRD